MAKKIMIQGTMSNAGKSLICAGLCRVFWQDGYRVAPFKSQNMALNSFVTEDGFEMGRAQVVQAQASKIKPDVRMNPILLKPTTDMGSQVIVNGRPLKNMSAAEYFAMKRELVPEILSAFNSLDEEYDIIVIEGAGSPAEINLKKDDIVNMGLAELVDSPVILVGDIDRGGVFAQLFGTVSLLEEGERKRVKALVINKFRGDRRLLTDGEKMLEDLCKIPVAGVVPYSDIDIDDEDSLSKVLNTKTEKKMIDIAVIRFSKISNFTDIMPFERFDNVSVRFVRDVRELKDPDMIILPGTKNTADDLLKIRECGLENAIKEKAKSGTLIFGICGGFQMLGNIIEDDGNESIASVTGMGLIDMETCFENDKVQSQVKGTITGLCNSLKVLNGLSYNGYEIHMGRSTRKLELPITENGNVYGTYIHGIFDEKNIAESILKMLCTKKGCDPDLICEIDEASYKEEQYDRLADIIRESLDMELIYDIIDGRR